VRGRNQIGGGVAFFAGVAEPDVARKQRRCGNGPYTGDGKTSISDEADASLSEVESCESPRDGDFFGAGRDGGGSDFPSGPADPKGVGLGGG
jgi:hypothetical protein